MLKVWDSLDHRATMDIDLLARASNQIDNLHRIITEVSEISCEEDGISSDVDRKAKDAQEVEDFGPMPRSGMEMIFGRLPWPA